MCRDANRSRAYRSQYNAQVPQTHHPPGGFMIGQVANLYWGSRNQRGKTDRLLSRLLRFAGAQGYRQGQHGRQAGCQDQRIDLAQLPVGGQRDGRCDEQ